MKVAIRTMTAAIPKYIAELKPEFFSGFNFTTASVACITAMINQ